MSDFNLDCSFCLSGENPSDAEVEHLLGLIAKYSLASHIFWGLWGIISVSSLNTAATPMANVYR